ncbi:MAG: diguanylate cyclase [Spirochaetales bacterium]|nr:diguanylate cyclase [Spirochaetales bacterium]
MEAYNQIDINIFSGIILLVITINTIIHYRNLPLSARYRMLLAISLLVILITDTLGRMETDVSFQTERILLYTLNYIYFLFQPLPVSLGLMYLFSIFRERRFSLGAHLLFLVPFFIGLAALVYSAFTGWIFYHDELNNYHRGPGMIVYAFTNYSFALPAFGLVLYYRDRIKRRTLLIVIAYTLLPMAGSLLQLMRYGIITAWPSFVLAVFITYIFLEVKNNEQDYLTGLLNRHYFEVAVYTRIDQYSKKGPFTLIVIDLNGFKAINDVLGHKKGDEFLQAAAVILTRSVSIHDTIARYGGDEFLIILETADPEVAEHVLKRIQFNIGKWNRQKNEPIPLALSAGYAVFDPQKHTDYSDLFDDADRRMFAHKNQGKPARSVE